jgi:hypothetical protein
MLAIFKFDKEVKFLRMPAYKIKPTSPKDNAKKF